MGWRGVVEEGMVVEVGLGTGVGWGECALLLNPRYNSSEGILTLWKRGGYAEDDDDSLQLSGPGLLYTTHLDLHPEADKIDISGTGMDPVTLTGNSGRGIGQILCWLFSSIHDARCCTY